MAKLLPAISPLLMALPVIKPPEYSHPSDGEIEVIAKRLTSAGDSRINDATRKTLETQLDALRRGRKKDMMNKRCFSLEQNDLTLGIYQEEVRVELNNIFKQNYEGKNIDGMKRDLEEALCTAMRVFIAYNVTGALNAEEERHFLPLLDKFGGAPHVSSTSGVEGSLFDRGTETRNKISKKAQTTMTAVTDDLKRAQERFILRLLTIDGEVPAPSVLLPAILILCKAIVSSTLDISRDTSKASSGDDIQEVPLFTTRSAWRMRVFFRHQLCLQHRSHTLFVHVADCVDAMMADKQLSSDPALLVEIGHIQRYYHKGDMAAETFKRAVAASGLTLEEASFLGTRTRWQTKQLAQSILRAQSTKDDGRGCTPGEDADKLPKTVDCEAEGFDLYDRPKASGKTPDDLTPLTPTDYAIILALSVNFDCVGNVLAGHHEQVYIERLIADPSPAAYVQRAAVLLRRAVLERRRTRVQQRAFLQVQELIDSYSSACISGEGTFYRTDSRYIFMTPFPSIWDLRRRFADMCFDDNLQKTALDLFEQTNDWEGVIKCCIALDKRGRAESLAREKLEDDPFNPMLWVALGEATHETQYLWKAWEISNHRVAAPMRALARFALSQEKWEQCLEYFDKAVIINPIFGGDWFTLGFAALRLHRLDRGASAFTRVCQIDPNDAYAWNNLGSILLEQGKTRPAFNALSQALLNNRRSWRMWINYFSVGTELQEVTECAHALNVAIEIGRREVRVPAEYLGAFTDSVIKYLKGEIAATDNDPANVTEETPEENERPKRFLTETQKIVGESDVAKVVYARADGAGVEGDEGEEETTDIKPLGHEAAEDTSSSSKAPFGDEAEVSSALQNDILVRFEKRVKEIFQRYMDLFVDNADLYDCVARLYRQTDGAAAAYTYRVKEYRVCSQQDQAYVLAEKFERLSNCLQSMTADAVAMTTEENLATEQNKEKATKTLDALTEVKKNIEVAVEMGQKHLPESREFMVLDKLHTSVSCAMSKLKKQMSGKK